MTSRKEIVKRCFVVPGVPRTISADHLVKNISIPDGGQFICGAVVEGAESDTNLQRWIFQLNNVLYATKLKETHHIQIKVEDQSIFLEMVDALESDIPLLWTQSRPEIPKRHHGPFNMGPYNPQMNPANVGAVSGYYMNYQPPGHEVVDQSGHPLGNQAGISLHDATKLKETQHVQIEVEDQSMFLGMVDALKSDWTQLRPEIPKFHHGPFNMGPYNPQMNPANVGAVSGYYMNYQPPGHEVVDQSGHTLGNQAGLSLYGGVYKAARKQFEAPQPQYESEEKCTAVLLRNVPRNVHKDFIEMFFENKKNFGGVRVSRVEINRQEKTAVVQFEDKEAVHHVLSKCPLKMRGVEVQLEKLEENENVHAKEDTSDDEMSEHVVEFDGTQTKILVEDIPESIEVEALEMYFEARKFKCCEVIDVDLDEEDRNAVIEFAEPSHVELVLKYSPHHLKGQKVSVQIYVPKRLDTIIVKGPPDIVNEDCLDGLEMYFDNKRKSGGGGVVEESTTFSAKENAVYITFEEDEVAQRVVNRGTHKVHKKEVEVTLFKPKRSTKRSVLRSKTSISDSKSSSVKQRDVKQPVKTIRVRGMNKISSRESVNWYFENKMRAGGGEIENRYTDEEDDDIVYIRFKEEEVANAVAEREHHTVDGVDLSVAVYTPPVPPPSYTNKILFKGLNEKITESVLGLFLEARANNTLVEGSLTYHADCDDTAIVTTEQDIDFEKLELACKSKPCEGSYLKVSCVPISNCIIVSNISNISGYDTKDMIELYFENNKRSNGGPVTKVEMFMAQGYCLVYFNDYKTVDSVLSKEQTFCGHTVEVKRYIPCIASAEGDSVNRRFRLPVSQLKELYVDGSDFWKSQTSKEFCMIKSEDSDCVGGRRYKQRQSDQTPAAALGWGSVEQLEESRDLMATILDRTRFVQRQMDEIHQKFETGPDVVCVTREQKRVMNDAFMCMICKGAMVQPMYATCCKSLIGCQQCVETWYEGSASRFCPKCKNIEGQQFLTTGLTEAIRAFATLIKPE